MLREPGIRDARVDWQAGEASVAYDPASTDPGRIAAGEIFLRPAAGGRHHYRARPKIVDESLSVR